MPSIRRILCPIDFSEASAHAIEHASAVAGWYRARLTVLHAYSLMFAPVPALPPPAERVTESELERTRGLALDSVQPAIRGGVDVDIVVEPGSPAPMILSHAAALPADLIVMGTHGAAGFERLVLGSVTEKILRKASCPVLTVPPRAHATTRFPLTRILCAVDFSEWSFAAVELASSFAQQSGAALELLHVIEWPWEEPPAPDLAQIPHEQAAALGEFRRYLVAGATKRLESLGTPSLRDRPFFTRVCHGKPYAEILRAAANDRVDLIVLGVHGRNPLDVMMFGSTANQIVRRATCSVLTLRR
jgi:nucleotide-binding universal stress UspA family protein